ncbi:thioredoxin family protein [Aeromicrobium massiliense]|uniref:thioredoxin family protein n=1 Tax=Aeromicrobium massiliense TaxID=1464554 RepID=UPI000578A77C|nr:thioredoxin family protein [Aeromicrobium massiliense]
MTGTWVLLGALAATVVVALLLRRRDGRFAATPAPAPDTAADERERVDAADLDVPLGERATLVQFSSSFCSPCRATRVLLSDVVRSVPGVVHVEVDAESHLDLVRRHRVLRTPTVLVLGPDGEVVQRASGVPRREQVLTALALAVPED